MDDSNIPAGFSSRGGEYGQQLAAAILFDQLIALATRRKLRRGLLKA
jgi:hypothetical protein